MAVSQVQEKPTEKRGKEIKKWHHYQESFVIVAHDASGCYIQKNMPKPKTRELQC